MLSASTGPTRATAAMARVRVRDFDDSPAIIPPGETYEATCHSIERLHLVEVVTHDFTLVALYVSNSFVPTKERVTVVGARVYQPGPAGVGIPMCSRVRVVLRNTTDHPLRARLANFEGPR